ncbi:MAG: flavodoxin-dependent (E)-4-hydroxy-3-methylbut-2-enyl-diphosphate synthase, partial [Bacillota bacterium]
MIRRTQTRKVMIKDLQIGGQNKIVLQTMAIHKTEHIDKVINEINTYATHGAELVRLAILDEADADAIKIIKARTNVLLVADIHFDYRLALKAIENGIDKIRINPGNIGSVGYTKRVVEACQEKGIPIRIGVNAGSLEKNLLVTHGRTAEAMVESAKRHIEILESLDFYDIILSLKASDVKLAIDAYRLAAETFSYPLHIGITEAGPVKQGTIKSVAGLAPLIEQGIGDTIRISLSGPRIEELRVAKTLLASFGLYNEANLISCPTCGRLSYDMMPLLAKVDDYLNTHNIKKTVAVMGCAVNGPGEAKDADIGIAGGKKEG